MRRGTLHVVMTVLSLCATSTALAGCTSDPGTPPPTTPPATSAAPSPSATPTPTPTPDAATPPERPDMSQVDAATAEAVAVYFLRLYPYVYATGDLTEWRALSHPECIFCASVATDVESAASQGELTEGGALVASESVTTEVTPGSWFSVAVRGVQEPWVTRDSDGVEIERVTEEVPHVFTVVVVREADAWLVRGVQVDERPT